MAIQKIAIPLSIVITICLAVVGGATGVVKMMAADIKEDLVHLENTKVDKGEYNQEIKRLDENHQELKYMLEKQDTKLDRILQKMR